MNREIDDDSIPSMTDEDDMCSIPSLPNLSQCSIPTLSVSAKDISVEDTTSLPTTSSVETTVSRETAAESSRSSSSNDFVSNIEEEMLKVSIDKANIDHTTEDYPIKSQSNHVPHLHTSQRQEERAANASNRLLSEADHELLKSPLELPTYKDNIAFPSSKTKIGASQEVSEKPMSTCGTQVQVKSKPDTKEQSVQAVESGIDDKPVENVKTPVDII